jgi:hypothetical protein
MNTIPTGGFQKTKHPLGLALAILLYAIGSVVTQANQWLYTDSLQNDWQNWSSQATIDLENTDPVYSGSHSMAVSLDTWGYLYLHHTSFDSSPYANLSFWINGGATGGQSLEVIGVLNSLVFQTRILLPALEANTWQFFSIPLTTLNVANTSSLDAFCINDATGTGQPTFYLDDFQLTAVPEPSASLLFIVGFLTQASLAWHRARARRIRH